MESATITSKGQITIPKKVRNSLGLNTGDKIEFIVTEERKAVIRPVSKKVDEVFGRLHRPGRKPASLEDMDNAIRKRMREMFK